jgi:hypothetical protein
MYSMRRRFAWVCGRALGTVGHCANKIKSKSMVDCKDRIPAYHMLPIPLMRFPHAGTSFWPRPANGQSSRNGESESRMRAIRSRAMDDACQHKSRLRQKFNDYQATVLYLDVFANTCRFPRSWRPSKESRISRSAAPMTCGS